MNIRLNCCVGTAFTGVRVLSKELSDFTFDYGDSKYMSRIYVELTSDRKVTIKTITASYVDQIGDMVFSNVVVDPCTLRDTADKDFTGNNGSSRGETKLERVGYNKWTATYSPTLNDVTMKFEFHFSIDGDTIVNDRPPALRWGTGEGRNEVRLVLEKANIGTL